MQLKKITLQSNNLRALAEFYKEVLELPVREQERFVEIQTGNSVLIFEESETTANPFYHFAFNIPSNKIDEAFEWAKKRLEILWLDEYNGYIADFKNWNAKSFYFLDPAGNIGELIARFDMNDLVTEKFSSRQFRNVSEIGLVFPGETFTSDVNEIVKKFQLDYFSKQPPLEFFKAIGDDEGLFVLVPKERNWFSTKLPAGIFPISIAFENNGKKHQLDM